MENRISDVLRRQDANETMKELFARAAGSEDVALRGAHVKHFDLGGGRRQAVVYAEPVHFRDPESGSWREVDNTLEETVTITGRRVLRNRAGRVRMEFPVRLDGGSMASLTADGRTFAWRFEQEPQPVLAAVRTGLQLKKERLARLAQSLPRFAGRTLESLEAADLSAELENAQERRAALPCLRAENTYEGVLPGVSVRYTVNGEALKEDIILENAEALHLAALRLPQEYDYEVTARRELLVKDQTTGKALFRMDAPLVYDAEGKETAAQPELADAGESIRLQYLISEAFLSEATFPVTIDPVVRTATTDAAVADTYIWEKNPDTNYGDVYLMRCGHGEGGESIALVRFKQLIALRASDTVISAQLRMHEQSFGSDSEYMGCYPIKTAWSETGATWNSMTPGNTDHISDDMLSYVTGTTGDRYFDITELYRGWYQKDANGSSRNFGVAIRCPASVTSGNRYVEWTASRNSAGGTPCLVVDYLSHAGRQDWWQYESQSCGRAGSAYVDLFNGNLVYEHADGATTGSRLPVAFTHVYNSCLSESNPVSCGNGWRTSMHQQVSRQTIGSASYYVWLDGGATEHYFKISGSQPYADEEGMNLSLTTGNSQLTITDRGDTRMIFPLPADSTWQNLTQIVDSCGNMADLTYTGGKLTAVNDGSGHNCTLSYNSAGLLEEMQIKGCPKVSFDYSGSNLIRISYSDATSGSTAFTYESGTNMLTGAQNLDGQKLTIGYEAASTYDSAAIDSYAAQIRRVTSLEKTAGSLKGAKQLFAYRPGATKVTAVTGTSGDAGKALTYVFNRAGNVTCVYDELGYARSSAFSKSVANQQTAASALRRAVMNRLSGLDFASGWTLYKGSNSDTSAQDTTARCLGMPSLKLTKASAAETRQAQSVTIPTAGTYTFSAYVKLTASCTGGLFLRIRSGSSVWTSRAATQPTASCGTGTACEGWDRLYVTATLPAGSAAVELVSASPSGSGWFACPQLETGGVPNHANLLTNGDFSGGATGWTAYGGSDSALNGVVSDSLGLPAGLSGNALRIASACNLNDAEQRQSVSIKGAAGDVFVLGGWVKSQSVTSGGTHFKPSLRLRFRSGSTWTDSAYCEFEPQRADWLFGQWAVAAPSAYSEVQFVFRYARNQGTAMFTNLFLHREEFGQSFAYDGSNRLTGVSTLSAQKSAMGYDSAHNLTSYRQPGAPESAKYTMNYGSSTDERKKHLLLSSVTPMGQRDVYTYDSFGNSLTGVRQKSGDSAYIRTETAYDASGAYAVQAKDARGHAVTRNVDAETGLLTSVTDPNGQTVSYAYDASKRVTGVQTTAGGKTYKNAYTYSNDRIQKVQHNTTSDTPDVEYTFGYDALGRKTTVKVGSQTLSTNVYASDRSGLLSEVQYGNGGKVKYAYDAYDRLTGVRYDGETSDRYAYEYGADGQASVVRDNSLGRVAQTACDLSGRATESQLRDASGNVLYRAGMTYDARNRLTGLNETANGQAHATTYAYDNDNRVTGMTFDGGNAISYTYDSLGRIASRTASPLSTTYGYVAGGYGTGSTTPLVASIQQTAIPFSYAYDSRGNIISETRSGQTTTYEYDALGQLIRVNDPHENATWVYAYDRGGNMTSKVRYAYTTGTPSGGQTTAFTYDSAWKDRLTASGQYPLTYDAIGNLKSYGGWTFEWEAGRQLKRQTQNATVVTYDYDHNGLRVRKTVANTSGYVYTTYNYIWHGGQLAHMTKGTDELHFFYDAQGRPAKVDYNGVIYTYVHNLQGDIVGILDGNGTVVVEYKYSAWGTQLSRTGELANTLGYANPFRYRGYIYDDETWMYWLRSRYYYPELHRFINADELLGVVGGLTTHNAYAYCANAPVDRADHSGYFAAKMLSEDEDGIPGPTNNLSGGATGMGYVVGGIVSGVTDGPIKKRKGDISDAEKTKIYRYGADKGVEQYVPTKADVASEVTANQKFAETNVPQNPVGLSFSLKYKTNSIMTTIEDVNNTGILKAVIDGKFHVTVFPTDGTTIRQWHDMGVDSRYSQVLMQISTICK